MKKQIRFIGYCLSVGLIAILTIAMAACSSTPASTPTATAASVVSISITPVSPGNLLVGATQQFIATETFSDGISQNITAQVTWASSNNTIATIASTGLATGVAAGNTNITAALSGVTSYAVILTVVHPTTSTTTTPVVTLSSIAVTPASPDSLAVGSTQQFKAVGTFSDNSSANITSDVTWASSDVKIATISAAGLATGLAVGNTSITAAFSGKTSPAIVLNVLTLSSIAITPASPNSLAVGSTRNFRATGMFTDGSTANITSQVTWASSNITIATMSSVGVTTGVAAGNTNITAALSGKTSPAITLTVEVLTSTTTSTN